MIEKINANELTEFKMSDYLNDQEDIAIYLEILTEDSDEEEMARALKAIAESKGMKAISDKYGIAADELVAASAAPQSKRRATIAHLCSTLGIAFHGYRTSTFTSFPQDRIVNNSK